MPTPGYRGRLLLTLVFHRARPESCSPAHPVEDNVATVMIVGHNPGLEELVARLTGEPETLPTAALAQIALPIDRWSDLNTSTSGTLVGLWRPKELS